MYEGDVYFCRFQCLLFGGFFKINKVFFYFLVVFCLDVSWVTAMDQLAERLEACVTMVSLSAKLPQLGNSQESLSPGARDSTSSISSRCGISSSSSSSSVGSSSSSSGPMYHDYHI